jgi:hypothetical protein
MGGSIADKNLKLFKKIPILNGWHDGSGWQLAGTALKPRLEPVKTRLGTSIFTVFVNSLTMTITA